MKKWHDWLFISTTATIFIYHSNPVQGWDTPGWHNEPILLFLYVYTNFFNSSFILIYTASIILCIILFFSKRPILNSIEHFRAGPKWKTIQRKVNLINTAGTFSFHRVVVQWWVLIFDKVNRKSHPSYISLCVLNL